MFLVEVRLCGNFAYMKHTQPTSSLSIIKPFERLEQKARSFATKPEMRFWLSCAGLIAVIALHTALGLHNHKW